MTTQVVDVNAAIADLTDVLARTLDSGVRVGKRLADGLWPATADRHQIELAVLNVGINARDAMPLGGTLTIETRNETLVGAQDDGLAPGQYVAIAVTDTGSGMAPDVLARALEPFFTTKELGKGTGLGLSMVYSTVRQLGGGVRIASDVGKGTCVTLYLPRAPMEVATPVQPLAALRRPFSPVTILLVEDDPSTRAAVAAYAGDLGHTVIVVGSGNEAIATLDAGQPVDVMVIDGTMPGMSSSELIDLALERRPGLPALLISGQLDVVGDALLLGAPILAKLFGQAAFEAALSALLVNEPASANVIPLRSKGA